MDATRSSVGRDGDGLAWRDGRTRFTISKGLPADTTLVIMAQTAPGSGSNAAESVGVALAEGDVPPCQVVDAPVGAPPFGTPPPGAAVHADGGGPRQLWARTWVP